MKVAAVVLRDADGERRIALDQLPLRLGTGSDCQIRLPGPGNAAIALLDELDGVPFLQPVGKPGQLQLNGQALVTSRRLSNGDELGFFGSRIVIGEQDDNLLVQVRLEDSVYLTRPPELPVAAGGAADETIAPTAFRRAADLGTAPVATSGYRWQTAVAVGLVALTIVSYLLFTARSIRFDVQPASPDELTIAGGWFRLPLGDRVLLRPGDYTVAVEKAGYYPQQQSFAVGDEPSGTVTIALRRLPGRLTVMTEPPVAAVVTVDEALVGPAPHGPLELEPGNHSVEVTAERFLPYRDRINVPGLGQHQQLVVQLVPRWATVAISSAPSGASIYVGQHQVGTTPASIELMEGSHELSVVREGFTAWDGVVSAAANEQKVLPTIELEPANARLQVASIPVGANVTVNGRYRGQSPITLALSPDIDYEIRLSKAGYGSVSRQVRLAAAASREITVDMTARTGTVNVNVLPDDATIFVDGQPRGRGSATFELSAAPHRVEVRKEGFQTFSRDVTPRPGYPQAIDVRLLSDEEVRRRSVAATMTTVQGQVLRRVEAGDLVMGSSRREQGRRANEVIVPVRVTRPFYLGEKEVTNREFRRFRENHNSGGDYHAALAGDNNPVANVTWADAVDYCNWLSAQEGLTLAYEKKFEKWEPVTPVPNGYRLPTEAEWALAMRFQGRREPPVFPWGDRMPPPRDSGNYADRSARDLVPSVLPGYDDGFASTAPVASFAPNALGFYDAGGNVAEWVQDYYSVPTPGQTEPLVNPTGPSSGTHHVIRGSSWRHSGILELRLAYREFGTEGRFDVGFRIARNVD